MNIAIIIGVPKYNGAPSDLPGCDGDVRALEIIVADSLKWDDKLVVADPVDSVSLKKQLTDFVHKHKESNIDEALFYFTGHGDFVGDEFYFLLNDYDKTRRKQTTLENNEVDSLLRALNPSLAVKIVDACRSGFSYIKSAESIDVFMKDSAGRFKKCYFLYSSQQDETSWQSAAMSRFTHAVVESVARFPSAAMRYKDVIDYVSDQFVDDPKQTPFFVTQADFTEQFCTVSDALRNKLNLLIPGGLPGPMAPADPNTLALKTLVQKDASEYCSKEEALGQLNALLELCAKQPPPDPIGELYVSSCTAHENYSDVPGIEILARWLHENPHALFAEAIAKSAQSHSKVAADADLLDMLRTGRQLGPDRSLTEFATVRPSVEMPYSYIHLLAEPRFPNLPRRSCFIVPFVSTLEMRVFWADVSYRLIGWSEYAIDCSIAWRSTALPLRDQSSLAGFVTTRAEEFWDAVLEPIKRKFAVD